MTEYFTEAVVLDKKESGDFDTLISLYTKDLGKVVAKAKSIRKITSKLAGHLEPLNFVRVRLIEKNGFQVVDALAPRQRKKSRASIENFSKLLTLLQFIKETTFELQPDPYFWLEIRKILISDFEGKTVYRNLLKILGFDPEFASCHRCSSKIVNYFYKTDQVFFCKKCSGKIPKDEVILI
ncbi:MAG: recombination protein O N-terminal domain-containing protein [Candidatus Paceibacterota bacterium]